MRNGNRFFRKLPKFMTSGSYHLTYEKWKPEIFCGAFVEEGQSSYPTYEEWKPNLLFGVNYCK